MAWRDGKPGSGRRQDGLRGGTAGCGTAERKCGKAGHREEGRAAGEAESLAVDGTGMGGGGRHTGRRHGIQPVHHGAAPAGSGRMPVRHGARAGCRGSAVRGRECGGRGTV